MHKVRGLKSMQLRICMSVRARKVWQQDGMTAGDEHDAWTRMDHCGTIALTSAVLGDIPENQFGSVLIYPNPSNDFIIIN